MKIIIDHLAPPIPVRSYDYVAYVEDEEDGNKGWGNTPANALLELAIEMGADRG